MNIKKDLKREIGVWGLSANLVNIIIGAGIFVLPAIVAEGLGAASIIAYLFCGVLIALIMLCFAEAGSKVTDTGGPYAYIEAAFGKYAGFLTAILFVCSAITADAAVANALVVILGSLIPVFTSLWVKIIFFLLLFSGLAYVNVKGVKQGIGLVKFNTVAKLTPLLLLVCFGWVNVSLPNLSWESTPSFTAIGEMSLILFFAFQGGESGLSVSGEVRQPQRTVPKAILIGISGVLVLYILIQVVAQGVLGASLSTFQEGPLAEVAMQVFGPVGFSLMTLGAAISMFGNLSGEVLSIPRVLYGAAKDDVIHSPLLARVHKKYATPYMAIAVYVGLGFFFASIGGFRQLAILSGAAILLVYLGVALAVIKLRKAKNTDPDTFTIPGGYTVPVASVIVIVWFLSNLTRQEQVGGLAFLGFLTLIYWIMHYLRKRKRRMPTQGHPVLIEE